MILCVVIDIDVNNIILWAGFMQKLYNIHFDIFHKQQMFKTIFPIIWNANSADWPYDIPYVRWPAHSLLAV